MKECLQNWPDPQYKCCRKACPYNASQDVCQHTRKVATQRTGHAAKPEPQQQLYNIEGGLRHIRHLGLGLELHVMQADHGAL